MANLLAYLSSAVVLIFLCRGTYSIEGDETFFYFGYGSNLLEKRLKIKNPSAERYGFGELKNYRLDFYNASNTWNGAPATIVEDETSVWGAIWTLNASHIDYLDEQEGVPEGLYFPLQVPIYTLENQVIECRTYQLTINPPNRDHGRLPSKTYHDVIVGGAKETGLPQWYIEQLERIENNGQLASQSMLEALGIA